MWWAKVIKLMIVRGMQTSSKAGSNLRAPGADLTRVNFPEWAQRLGALGLHRISGGGWCTVGDASRFFSFRRDRRTGRLAAGIALLGR